MSVPQVPLGQTGGAPRALNIPPIVLLFAGACLLIELLRAYWISSETDVWLLYHFAFIPARYADVALSSSWQAFTTPLTYSVLHGGFGHLINNCLWLVVFGSPLAATIGNARFALFWFVCAAIGALFHYWAQPQDMVPMIGASGAISGMMGAAARYGFRMTRTTEGSRFRLPAPTLSMLVKMPNVIVFLAIYFIMNFGIGLAGTAPGGASIAWQAHLGGILAGFLVVPMFAQRVR
jgi:membrane associated rhomboid family serine protease